MSPCFLLIPLHPCRGCLCTLYGLLYTPHSQQSHCVIGGETLIFSYIFMQLAGQREICAGELISSILRVVSVDTKVLVVFKVIFSSRKVDIVTLSATGSGEGGHTQVGGSTGQGNISFLN